MLRNRIGRQSQFEPFRGYHSRADSTQCDIRLDWKRQGPERRAPYVL